MLVSDWMTRDVLTVPSKMSVREVAGLMSKHHIRRVPVVAGARLRGIVSSFDVARAFPPDLNPFAASMPPRAAEIDRPVDEIMTRQVCTLTPSMPLEEAAGMLRARKIGAAPVVSSTRLVGIITESDIFRALVAALGAERAGVRVTFDLAESEDAVSFTVELAKAYGMRISSVLTLDREGRRMAVVRLAGTEPDGLVEAIWASGHKVLSVLRS